MQVPSILQGESLKRLLQGAAVGAVATIIVGFNWGGWSLGSTADKMAKERSELAVVAALAPVRYAALFEVYRACRRHQRCQLKGTETSVRLRFMGSSRTSYCLSRYLHGVPDVKHNRRSRN